jgi:hypothetical protein
MKPGGHREGAACITICARGRPAVQHHGHASLAGPIHMNVTRARAPAAGGAAHA